MGLALNDATLSWEAGVCVCMRLLVHRCLYMIVPMVVIVKMLWLRETKRKHARTHTHTYVHNKLIRCIHLYRYVRPWLLQPTPSPPRDGFIPQPTPSPPRDGLNPTIATATAVYPLSVVATRRNRSNTIESLLGVGVDLTRQSRRSCHADVRFAPIYLE